MELTCLKCGHKWNSRKENPIECPYCTSRNWKGNKRMREIRLIADAILEKERNGYLSEKTIKSLEIIKGV